MFQIKFVEKIKKHILRLINFFCENRAVYEIMSKNLVESDMPQMKIRRMHDARWVSKTTHARARTRKRQ
jgi:hypothetical protein